MRYTLEIAKDQIYTKLSPFFESIIFQIITFPKNINCDFSIPVFKLAQHIKQDPIQLAIDIAQKVDLSNTYFENVEGNNGYLNFKLRF